MRASRLLSIMILLQLRRRVTAADLAAEFEVSLRTIYRDIDALSAAGVPVFGDRGPGGGFQLLDGYRTHLTGLNPEEAEALTMIGLPGPAAELGLRAAAGAAKRKMLAALPAGGGAIADRMAARFHLDPLAWYSGGEDLPYLPVIARAVLDERRIEMRYEGWQGTHEWLAEPVGLILKGGVWYLAAAARGKVRAFRVAGIDAVRVSDDTFERPDAFDLAAWWAAEQQRFEAELFAVTATVRASALGCKRLAAQSRRGAKAVASTEPADADGWRTVTMEVEDSDHGARDVLALGPEVEVVAPAGFRQRIAELAQRIAALHTDASLATLRGPFAGTAGHLDAPYAETGPMIVEAMLDLAGLQPGERLLDLGSGDGRIVLAAARRGAEALGVDIDPVRVAEAEKAARDAGLSALARFRCEDLFATPLGEADVITLFLLGHVNAWLGPRLRAEARPGTRIVSHAFPIAEWEPVAVRRSGSAVLHLWVV